MILTVIRVYLGWTWLEAGLQKIVGSQKFDATSFLTRAIHDPVTHRETGEMIYPLYVTILENFALTNVKIINFLIPCAEIFVGIGLILGIFTMVSLFMGLTMNFLFLFAGSVSMNPLLILLSFIVFTSHVNAQRFGGDYYVKPVIQKILKKA